MLLVAISVALFLAGLWLQFSLEDLVLTVLVPIPPLATWSLREFYRQRDAATAQETAKANAESFWAKAVAGALSEPEIEKQSREFQDAIFNRRASSPLLPPGVYWALRSKLEDQMNVGAEALVREYFEKLGSDGEGSTHQQ